MEILWASLYRELTATRLWRITISGELQIAWQMTSSWLVVAKMNFIFHDIYIYIDIWDKPSHWLIFFRGVETTNQVMTGGKIDGYTTITFGYSCLGRDMSTLSGRQLSKMDKRVLSNGWAIACLTLDWYLYVQYLYIYIYYILQSLNLAIHPHGNIYPFPTNQQKKRRFLGEPWSTVPCTNSRDVLCPLAIWGSHCEEQEGYEEFQCQPGRHATTGDHGKTCEPIGANKNIKVF